MKERIASKAQFLLLILFVIKLIGVTIDQYWYVTYGYLSYSNLSLELILSIKQLLLTFTEQLVLLISILSLFIRSKYSLIMINLFSYLSVSGGLFKMYSESNIDLGLGFLIFGLVCVVLGNSKNTLKSYGIGFLSKQQFFQNLISFASMGLLLFLLIAVL
ncbi:hypothetical protein AVL50_06785 [Flammeovirga sp. SJP92]|nr:hypothetical protein AVL50_06785 [Flammeovirga sp. SJP92]